MVNQLLMENIFLEHTPDHLHVEFTNSHRVISSAVLNGGFTQANHIVNMKVPKHSNPVDSPDVTLNRYCTGSNWYGTVVGMMTAASMDSLRIVRETAQGVDIVVLVTSGLSNPRRVGDRAEYRSIGTKAQEIGTINIIVLTSANLLGAAMVEALMVTTEGKAAALQTLGVRSTVSNDIATGTGTDALAIASGNGPEEIRYCGKHVLFGEMLGRLVIEAVTDSVNWDINQLP